MSQYLMDQLDGKSNITSKALFQAEVAAVHGDVKLEAINMLQVSRHRGGAPPERRALHLAVGMRTPPGCRRRSPSTAAATCPQAPMSLRAGDWAGDRDPYLLRA